MAEAEQPKRKNLKISKDEVFESVQSVDGIQVNHCKNPLCENFGVAYTGKTDDPNYKRSGSVGAKPPIHSESNNSPEQNHPAIGSVSRVTPFIQCQKCNECPPLKNNSGIVEILKLWDYHPDNFSCPNSDCDNHNIPISTVGAYKKNGTTKTGTTRWRCKACGKSFVERAKSRPSRENEKPYRYEDIILGLVNNMPFNRMIEIYKVSPKTIYDNIEKAYKSCVRFNKNREQRLPEVLNKRGAVYFATDRQDLLVNWKDRKNRNAISIKATCSVDVQSGFVYRYDVGIDDLSDAFLIHSESLANGDVDKAYPFRKYPHLFIPTDMSDERRINGYIEQELLKARQNNPRVSEEQLKYYEAELRPNVELPSFHLTKGTGLPQNCLLLREDYQLYAHYFALKALFANTNKTINFADQESGLRAAFMAAFSDKVVEKDAHLFYITFEKGVIQEDREEANARTKSRIITAMAKYGCDEKTAKHLLCVEAIRDIKPVGQWNDQWGDHPLESMTEVYKRFSHQTYHPDQDDEEIGYYLTKAGLHAVDNHFMRVRRRISQMERGLPTASGNRKIWYGKNFYRPDMVKKTSTILMTYLNYCTVNNSSKPTPAEKLGIAKGAVRLKDILVS